MKNRYAVEWLTIDDVKGICPKMTRKEAMKWLEKHEDAIKLRMFEVANEYIRVNLYMELYHG